MEGEELCAGWRGEKVRGSIVVCSRQAFIVIRGSLSDFLKLIKTTLLFAIELIV